MVFLDTCSFTHERLRKLRNLKCDGRCNEMHSFSRAYDAGAACRASVEGTHRSHAGVFLLCAILSCVHCCRYTLVLLVLCWSIEERLIKIGLATDGEGEGEGEGEAVAKGEVAAEGEGEGEGESKGKDEGEGEGEGGGACPTLGKEEGRAVDAASAGADTHADTSMAAREDTDGDADTDVVTNADVDAKGYPVPVL